MSLFFSLMELFGFSSSITQNTIVLRRALLTVVNLANYVDVTKKYDDAVVG